MYLEIQEKFLQFSWLHLTNKPDSVTLCAGTTADFAELCAGTTADSAKRRNFR